MTHHHSQEAFNRASHSDALREMQLVPAEDMQHDMTPIYRESMSPISAFVMALALAVLGVMVVVS